ncbi:elongation factor P 5-aminopentanone reductase [Brevibacillus ginsengisoli]|uniref:elongation factor P 5-aminopentanone reductase n=1 Tax=Brevibacillus ginsengisoli TaxID=363854 RepID=UPI003CF4612D
MRQTPWALITGASGEIGQAIAIQLAAQGVPLYLHYFQSPYKLEPIISFCQERGVPYALVQADLRNPIAISDMYNQLLIKPLLLVNNASIDHLGVIQDVSPSLFDELVSTNVRSAFFMTQAALTAMIQEQYGRIVNVSSIWGLTGGSCEVLYSLTKGAINSFTKALAKEVARSGITVNAVAPGAIDGGMMERFSLEEKQEIAEDIPMGRLGQPAEIASLVSFLLSREASYITGQVISPNGGWYT